MCQKMLPSSSDIVSERHGAPSLRAGNAGWRVPLWWLAMAALLAPVLVDVARTVWSTEQGSHGPVLLATAIWLIAREWPGRAARRPSGAIGPAVLALALAVYLIAQRTGVASIAWLSAWGACVALIHQHVGTAGLRAMLFPLGYMALLVPPPGLLAGALSDRLNVLLAEAATALMHRAGYDSTRQGAVLFVDQYELQMIEACAGLGSLGSLFLLGMLYIYLRHRASWRYAVVLALLIPPVAVAANFARIVLLLWVTVTFGDGVAQGVAHPMAGLTMFAVGLALLMLADHALRPLRRRLEPVWRG
jgi:exosortase